MTDIQRNARTQTTHGDIYSVPDTAPDKTQLKKAVALVTELTAHLKGHKDFTGSCDTELRINGETFHLCYDPNTGLSISHRNEALLALTLRGQKSPTVILRHWERKSVITISFSSTTGIGFLELLLQTIEPNIRKIQPLFNPPRRGWRSFFADPDAGVQILT